MLRTCDIYVSRNPDTGELIFSLRLGVAQALHGEVVDAVVTQLQQLSDYLVEGMVSKAQEMLMLPVRFVTHDEATRRFCAERGLEVHDADS